MNATDTREYIVKGFAELKAMLEAQNSAVDEKRLAEIAAAQRQRAQDRVREEYAQYGMEPPSALAFSITTRLEMGTAEFEQPEYSEDAA